MSTYPAHWGKARIMWEKLPLGEEICTCDRGNRCEPCNFCLSLTDEECGHFYWGSHGTTTLGEGLKMLREHWERQDAEADRASIEEGGPCPYGCGGTLQFPKDAQFSTPSGQPIDDVPLACTVCGWETSEEVPSMEEVADYHAELSKAELRQKDTWEHTCEARGCQSCDGHDRCPPVKTSESGQQPRQPLKIPSTEHTAPEITRAMDSMATGGGHLLGSKNAFGD